MTNKIRNFAQSHQEREIVKTAPDMVVYFDGMPYVINPWINSRDGGVVVNVNDFISAISLNYGVDKFIPSGSINISVPSHSRYLFQAPGGNRIFNSMDEIQIFCKGYFLSASGNSIYHRVFHGLIQGLTYVDTGTSLEITISIAGVLRLFEIMHINMAPSVLNHGDSTVIPYIDKFASMEPLSRIAATFMESLSFDAFTRTSIVEQKIKGSPAENAIQLGFINKWSSKLASLRKLVRIFGLKDKTGAGYLNLVQSVAESADSADPQKKGLGKKVIPVSESDLLGGIELKRIQEYLPGMGVGQIDLVNSKTSSRLEQLRNMLNAILFEGYQDIDGKVIVKPPLFNLDVTNIKVPKNLSSSKDPRLCVENNPFVIYPAEVESENEMEDETRIVATRMTVQGVLTPGFQFDMAANIKSVASFIDIPLLSRFGIRESSPRTIHFLGNNSNLLYAFAASELRKANKGFRTYNCTIPLRPEIKLGFPVYIAHHDMYAYPETISISYNVGGKATMTLSCDTLRKRPMVGQKIEVPDEKDPSKKRKLTVYESKPNLVHKFVDVTEEEVSKDNPEGQPSMLQALKAIPNEQLLLRDLFKHKLHVRKDTQTPDKSTKKASMWMVQSGDADGFNPLKQSKVSHEVDGKSYSFTVVNGDRLLADDNYLNIIRVMQPYTDEHGYELVSPLPWGRWVSLPEAIICFTDSNYLDSNDVTRTAGVTRQIQDAKLTLVTLGLATAQGTPKAINSYMKTIQEITTSAYITSFELKYASTPEAQQVNTSELDGSQDKDNLADLTAMCLTGESQRATSGSKYYSRNYALGWLETDTSFSPLGASSVTSSAKEGTWLNSFTNSVQGSSGVSSWPATMKQGINSFGSFE